MPVSLAGLDVHDIPDGDFALFALDRGDTSTGGNHQDLVAVVDMPAGGGADAEVHHVAAKIFRLSIADDRLPGAAHRAAGPSGNRCRRVHRSFRQIAYFEYTHVRSPCFSFLTKIFFNHEDHEG